MRILISGTVSLVDAILRRYPTFTAYLGWLNTPRKAASFRTFQAYTPALPIACDNSAYVNFDEASYTRFVDRCPTDIEWLTAPDVVGDAVATLNLFHEWQPRLSHLPIAYVAQDGSESMDLPFDNIRTLFIGGSTEWKLSPAVEQLIREAKRLGKTVHMGRVNSNRRLSYAYHIGCDSVDGTGYSQYGKNLLLPSLCHLDRIHNQMLLRFPYEA